MKLLLVVALVLSFARPALAADHAQLVTPAWLIAASYVVRIELDAKRVRRNIGADGIDPTKPTEIMTYDVLLPGSGG